MVSENIGKKGEKQCHRDEKEKTLLFIGLPPISPSHPHYYHHLMKYIRIKNA